MALTGNQYPDYDAVHVSIASDNDIVMVRKDVRNIASEIGFGITDVTRIVTAASELARNIVRFAGKGYMTIIRLNSPHGPGVSLIFKDKGPGISDIDMALQEGYTTARGLGLGLPGAKRLMDEMEIQSTIGEGTTICVIKWLKKKSHEY